MNLTKDQKDYFLSLIYNQLDKSDTTNSEWDASSEMADYLEGINETELEGQERHNLIDELFQSICIKVSIDWWLTMIVSKK